MGIERTEFSSGLRVVTERMPGVRSVSLGWVLAGSRDEPPAIRRLEPLPRAPALQGNEDEVRPRDRGGLRCRRRRRERVHVEGVHLLLRTHPRRRPGDGGRSPVRHVPGLGARSADLDAERQVILEEINMHEDSPEEVVHDLFTEALWPNHPLGGPSSAPPRRSARRRETRSTGSTASTTCREDSSWRPRGTSVTRSCSTCSAVAWTRDGSCGRGTRRDGTSAPARPPRVIREAVGEAAEDRASAHLSGHERARAERPRPVPLPDRERRAGTGMSSRLFQEIREKRGLVYSVYSYHSQYTEAGLFSCYAGTTPARAQEVIGLLRRELDDVAEGGLTAEEFDRAKGHVKGSMVLSLEDQEPDVEDRQVEIARRDPHGEPVPEARGGRFARGRTTGGQAGAVATDDPHRPRAVRAARSRGVMS